MKRKLLLISILVIIFKLYNCTSPKNAIQYTKTSAVSTRNFTTIEKIINTALTYKGTRYKYGGTSRKGMDCSGLMYKSFTLNGVPLNRSSYQIAKQGKNISLQNVKKGDLIFFTIGGNNRINHVGLVIAVGGCIKFIHSTTSKGVITSSMDEKYWKKNYTKAKRIL